MVFSKDDLESPMQQAHTICHQYYSIIFLLLACMERQTPQVGLGWSISRGV